MTLPKYAKELERRVVEFLQSYAATHATFAAKAKFSGPSLYFHRRALTAFSSGLDAFAEASYAMLVAWGMHRMGSGGAKMQEFDAYRRSIETQWSHLTELRKITPATMSDDGWVMLRAAFSGINSMAGKTILVANSKVLAHALPSLVAPVDRQYTLRYLNGTRSAFVHRDRDRQADLFIALHRGFFHPLATHPEFKAVAESWVSAKKCDWDTSILKVADNCIVAASGHRSRSA